MDLTHAFAPGIPQPPASYDMRVADAPTFDKDGFWSQRYALVGQWRTHCDPDFVLGVGHLSERQGSHGEDAARLPQERTWTRPGGALVSPTRPG